MIDKSTWNIWWSSPPTFTMWIVTFSKWKISTSLPCRTDTVLSPRAYKSGRFSTKRETFWIWFISLLISLLFYFTLSLSNYSFFPQTFFKTMVLLGILFQQNLLLLLLIFLAAATSQPDSSYSCGFLIAFFLKFSTYFIHKNLLFFYTFILQNTPIYYTNYFI